MAAFTKAALSGSTNGRAIQVAATSSAGTTIHTSGSDPDEVFLWATNTSTSAVTLTLEWGATGVANEADFQIPPNDTVYIVPGWLFTAALTVAAYADTANVVNIIGWRIRFA